MRVLVVFALLASPLFADVSPKRAKIKLPDRPWASFPVGSWVQYKTTTHTNGQDNTSEYKMTLAEMNGDKAVIDYEWGGRTHRMEYPLVSQVTQNVIKKGTERITVGGKKYDCVWQETEMQSGDMTIKTKSWFSPKVPSLTVKMEASGYQNGMSYEMELLDFGLK